MLPLLKLHRKCFSYIMLTQTHRNYESLKSAHTKIVGLFKSKTSTSKLLLELTEKFKQTLNLSGFSLLRTGHPHIRSESEKTAL